MTDPAPLSRSRIAAGMRNRRFTDIRVLGVVTSTNDVALRLAEDGVAPGLALIAAGQTAGRGRHGAPWVSTPGSGLFLSALIEKPAPLQAPLVAGAAGIAAARAIRSATGAEARIKWPNDLWLEGRKVGGVLIEVPGGDAAIAVVGIGITLLTPQDPAAPPGAAPLAGLSDLLGREVDREGLAAAVLDELDEELALIPGDPDEIRRRYRDLDVLKRREIKAEIPGGTITGRVVDVDLVLGIGIVTTEGARTRLSPEHTHIVSIKSLHRILLGSANRKKLDELRRCLADLPIDVISPADLPSPPAAPEEPHRTFVENAIEKARFYAGASGLLTLADDSGLEVDALGGLPGVDSAYFAGRPTDDAANNRKLLADLRGIPAPKRTARYRCTLALALPDRVLLTTEATCEGRIAEAPVGTEGFGYDPLFLVDGGPLSFGQLDARSKDRISHRGQALAKLRAALPGILAQLG